MLSLTSLQDERALVEAIGSALCADVLGSQAEFFIFWALIVTVPSLGVRSVPSVP